MEQGDSRIQAMISGHGGHETIGSVKLFFIRRLVPTGHSGMMTPAKTSVHCFFFLKRGEVKIDISEQRISIVAGNCLIIPKGQVFSVSSFSMDSEGYMGGFNDNFILPAQQTSFLYSWMNTPIQLTGKQLLYVENIFERINDEWSESKDLQIIRAYMQALLAELYRYRSNTSTRINASEIITGRFLALLSNGEEKLSGVNDYASMLNITPGHLSKCVKQITGKTPIKWIEETIITNAKMMLFQTNMQIGEIAEKLGINDISYFSRKFKLSEGVTPLEFKKLIKKS